jgi:HSP20 family protein
MLVRFDPFRDFDRITEQFDRVWNRAATATVPMNAIRHGNEVVVSFDLPGVDPDAIDLTVERDVLTVSASRQLEHQDGDQVLANERPTGSFTRRVLLGESLDTDKLDASYDRGVLTVRIPVAEQAQPRKIPVGSSTGQTAIDARSAEQ